jgi:hypothetical protein
MAFEQVVSRAERHGLRVTRLRLAPEAGRAPASRPVFRRAGAPEGLTGVEQEDVIAHGAWVACALVIAWAALFVPVKAVGGPTAETLRLLRLTRGDLSDRGMLPVLALDPSAAMIALRIAPVPSQPLSVAAAGPVGAAALPTTQDLPGLSADQARAINAAIPLSVAPNPQAKPFVMPNGDLLDQTRAVDCLTAAVYYEAASEPLEGQQAVAQVVLNRVRHPAFPKTVCGVVFQGSNQSTGCQFTFTCDGSMNRTPQAGAWERARRVAEAALAGFVMKSVGDATHYHTDYVVPYWATTLTKIAKVGSQIFYRWNGGWGAPGAFRGLYAGAEPVVDLGSAPAQAPALDQALAQANGLTLPDAGRMAPPQVVPASIPVAAPTVAAVTPLTLPRKPDRFLASAPPTNAPVSAPTSAPAPARSPPVAKAPEGPPETISAGPLWERH